MIGISSRDPIGFEGSEWGLFEYCGSKPLVSLDAIGLSFTNMNCCGKCKCVSLNVNDIGWRLLDLGNNGPYQGPAVSYVFTVNADTSGDRGCVLNTTVSGSYSVTYDVNAKTRTYKPDYLRRNYSDGSCALPWFGSSYQNYINCGSRYNKPSCSGDICYLDGPGLPTSWFPKRYNRACFNMNLRFHITCTGGLSLDFPIVSRVCVHTKNPALMLPTANVWDFCGIEYRNKPRGGPVPYLF